MKNLVRRNPYVFSLLTAPILLSASCSNIWVQPEATRTNPTGPNSVVHSSSGSGGVKYSTTSVGAMTGAALGAVTGLAIGSTTGNAGEGLVLGTAAGAAAGAGVGSAIQRQDERLASQQEAVRRQEEAIQRQGAEIKDLRNHVIDGQFPIPPNNRSSLGAPGGSNPQAQPFAGSAGVGDSRARLGSTTSKTAIRERISVNEINLTAPSAPRTQQGTTAVQSVTSSQVAMPPEPRLIGVKDGKVSDVIQKTPSTPSFAVTPPSNNLPVAAGLSPSATTTLPVAAQSSTSGTALAGNTITGSTLGTATTQMGSSTAVVKATSPTVQAPREIITAPKVEAPKAPVVAKATTEPPVKTEQAGDGCTQANNEAVRGGSATSDADKLFYFRRAIRLCPSEASYYVEVGRVYVTIGRTEDAQLEFNKALELDPENEAAQNELSMIMLGAAY